MTKQRHSFLTVLEGLPIILYAALMILVLTIFAFLVIKTFLYQAVNYPYESALRITLLAGLVLVVFGWNWMLERFFGEELAERLVQTTWIPIIALGTALFGFTNTIHFIINFFKSLWSDIF